jgi:hypothetical protein
MAAACVVSGKNLTVNPTFEEPGGWRALVQDGAEGSLERVADLARTGKYSYRMIKKNGVGYLQLRSERPVKVEAGKRYTFRAWFHAEDSEFSTLLLLRINGDKADRLYYDSIDRSAGYPSQSFLVNGNPGEWHKRVVHFQSSKDEEIYLNVVLYGNPATAWIDDLEFEETDFSLDGTPGEKRVNYIYSKEDVYEVLKKREPASAVIKNNEFILNSRKTQPVMYKVEPYLDNHHLRRYNEFVDSGVPLQFCVAGFSVSKNTLGVVLGPGKYDFDKLEGILMDALRFRPEANLIVEYSVYAPYNNWGEENPDECWLNAEGLRGYGVWGNLEGFSNDLSQVKLRPHQTGWFKWWYPSYSSEKYRQDTIRAISDVTAMLMASPLGRAVAGFHISGGHDGQFQYREGDFSENSKRDFRQWLEKEYGDISTLNKAWKTSYRSFPEIGIPKDPVKESPLIRTPGATVDYRRFQNYTSWYLKNLFAAAVKKAAGKDVTVSCYGMPTAYECAEAVQMPDLDLFGDASWYPFRRPGYPIGANPPESYALHNKMWNFEMDTRTWTGGASNEVYDMWLGTARTPAAWTSTDRKMSGVSLAKNYSRWYYSMNRYFDAPEIMNEIKATLEAGNRLTAMPVSGFRPDVCLVKSMSNHYYQKDGIMSKETTSLPAQTFMFELSGVPYDTYYLEEVLANEQLQHYKVYIFMHNLLVTRTQQAEIDRLLKKDGKTLVWVFGAGYLDENGKSAGNIRRLTGIGVDTSDKAVRLTPVLTAADEWTRDVQPFQGIAELYHAMFQIKGMSSFVSFAQEFWVNDPEAKTLGTYRENGKTSMAVKKFPQWTSVYCAAPYSLTNRMIHRIAVNGGAFVCGKPGQSIFMNGNFISLHGIKPEKYEIALPPGKTKIIDLFTGREASRTVEVEVGKTYWFAFE